MNIHIYAYTFIIVNSKLLTLSNFIYLDVLLLSTGEMTLQLLTGQTVPIEVALPAEFVKLCLRISEWILYHIQCNS